MRCVQRGWPTPICSAAPEVPVRRPRRGSWPKHSIAPTSWMVSHAGCVTRVSRLRPDHRLTSPSWTPPPTMVWKPCASWCRGRRWVRRGGARCTSWTKCTCSPQQRPTRYSRHWKSLPITWCSCWPPPIHRRCCPPSEVVPSISSSICWHSTCWWSICDSSMSMPVSASMTTRCWRWPVGATAPPAMRCRRWTKQRRRVGLIPVLDRSTTSSMRWRPGIPPQRSGP